MIRGFYTARSGLLAHQEHMSVMANNLANVNTVGFKPMRTAFTDLMYQNLNRVRNENVAQTGHGVKINKNDIMMNQGAFASTGGQFDFAIVDEGGFFAVQTPSGEVRYTRAGDFRLSNSDDTYYLVDGGGNRVLTADGSEIEVEFEQIEYKTPVLDADGNPQKDQDGNIIYDTRYGEGGPIVDMEQIGVFRFPNPWGLESRDGTTFVETEMSGEAEVIETPALKAGYLENSGVEIALEMTNVIESSKAFSFNSKMVQVADEIEQTVNSLR